MSPSNVERPKGSIIKQVSPKTGAVTWRLKYDAGRDEMNRRIQCYKTVRGSEAEARAKLAVLLNQVEQGGHVAPKKKTLSIWMEEWLETTAKPSVTSKSLERYSELLRNHVAPYLGEVQLQRLTQPQIKKLYARLRLEGRKTPGRPRRDAGEPRLSIKTGLSEQSILHVHRVLSNCLSEAVRARLISVNPMKDMRAPSPKKAQAVLNSQATGAIKALSVDDLKTLLCGIRGHAVYPLAVLAAGTGMRRGEMLALRWGDIDFESKSVRVLRAVEETKAHGVRIKDRPKNKSSVRIIGVDSELLNVLRRHKATQAEVALGLGIRISNETLVFPKSAIALDQPMRPMFVTDVFSRLAKGLGFGGFTLHDLRHTHASLLLAKRVPITAVAQRLGHASPTITLNIYSHLVQIAEDEAVTASAAILKDALSAD